MNTLSRRSILAAGAGAMIAGACASTDRKRRSTTPTAFDRLGFVEDVRSARAEGQDAVAEVIARAVSEPGSVVRALGEPKRATIELLYRDPELSVFNIVWPPMAVLVPHDHLMWASIGVYAGREDNIEWEPTGETLQAMDATTVGAGDVFSLPSDAIHSVINPVEQHTGALHVYGGDLAGTPRSQWDPLTLRREPFDVEDGRRILEEAERRFQGAG